MLPRWFGRVATVTLTASALVTFVACDDQYYDGYGHGPGHRRSCESPVQQCQTVCRDYCDVSGCYPYCEDDCWTDCDDGATSGSSGGLTDAATNVVDGAAADPDAATPTSDGGGAALCAPCATNADCQEGALCIFYGVPSASSDAGGDPDAAAPRSGSASFCGAACTGGCPTGFTCATLGTRQQCVPSAGRCN